MFYDHEQDGELTLGRRRAVADWGADAVFSHTARRRFSRPQTPRRVSGPAAPRRMDEIIAASPRALQTIEPPPSPARASVPPPLPVEQVSLLEPVATGRKTVTITGRPGALAHVPRPALDRQRPARTVAERFGHRPDHVAAFAFALGLLLILVAVATAHAG